MFTVEKVQLLPERDHIGHVELEVPKHGFGIYRTDTGVCLGVVGDGYTVVQNDELLDITLGAAKAAGLEPTVDYKELQGGCKVAFQVPLPDWSLSGDTVRRYASCISSHDGSSALGIGLTGVKVFCMNTWLQAMRSVQRARHTQSISEKIIGMKAAMIETIEQDKYLYEVFRDMEKQPFIETDIDPFIKSLTGIDVKEILDMPEGRKRSRNLNTYEDIRGAILQEFQDTGKTNWGAFNGVTRYTNHVIERSDQLDYIYFKTGRKLSDKAFKLLVTA